MGNKIKKQSSGKKKWTVLLIISLILLVAEGVVAGLYIWPQYNIVALVNAIKDVDKEKANKAAERIYDSYNDEAIEVIDDYTASLCMKYEDSKIDFDKLEKTFQILRDIELTKEIGDNYFSKSSKIELTKLITSSAMAYCDGDYDLANENDDKIYSIYSVMETNEFNSIISEIASKSFEDYLDEKADSILTVQVFEVCMERASENVSSQISELISRVYIISDYREEYVSCEEMFEEESYIEVCKAIDQIKVDDDDTNYVDAFSTLHDKAYETGLTYYIEKATNLASGTDKTKAKEMVEKVKEFYGDKIDMSSVEDLLVEPWMKAYNTYIDKWEDNLKSDLSNTDSGKYLLECEPELNGFTPDKIFLYDIDDNKTPELFLWIDNGSDVNSCYIIGFDGKNAIFLGYYDILYFAFDSQMICGTSRIDALGRGTGEEYYLYKLSSNQFKQTSDCAYSPTTDGYSVNGADATVEEFNNKIEEFKALSKNEDATTVKSVSINDYSDFILEYK